MQQLLTVEIYSDNAALIFGRSHTLQANKREAVLLEAQRKLYARQAALEGGAERLEKVRMALLA